MEGAAKRLRPKFMTVATMFVGLIPIMWAAGTGSDVWKRIAAPMVGGIFTSFVLELVVYPAIYEIWKWHFEMKRCRTKAQPRALAALAVARGGVVTAHPAFAAASVDAHSAWSHTHNNGSPGCNAEPCIAVAPQFAPVPALAMHTAEDQLTAHELHISKLIAKGNANKEIAAQLAVAEDTVKKHVTSILEKLGANDRTHAVTIALKRGIFDL